MKNANNQHIWKTTNEKYLFELQKFLDLLDNVKEEKLRKELIYQLNRFDKVITEIAEQHIAQATNLIFFIPTSLIAIIVNVKNKNVNLKLGLIIAVYGILGAIVGANVSMHLDMKSLRKYFGIFLLVVSVHEIYSIIKQYKKEKIDKNKSKL